jgi:hypothetical protein
VIRPAYVWGAALLLYVAFFGWYTNLGGPLTADEIEMYIERMVANEADPERLALMRKFLEEDTGDDFIMATTSSWSTRS